jgi:hypothetical protein
MAGDETPFEDGASGITRKQMADGGEVVTGKLVSKTLQAVGARAMTLDKTVFVPEGFDPDDPEDQALYAHEEYHRNKSGGEEEHGSGHDEEEKQARAIERMVLHRRAKGEDFGSIMRDVDDERFNDPAQKKDNPSDPKSSDDPMEAYRGLIKAGWSHDAIVRLLTQEVLSQVLQGDSEASARSGPTELSTEFRR